MFSQDDPDGPVTRIQDFLPNSALTAGGMPVWDNAIDVEWQNLANTYLSYLRFVVEPKSGKEYKMMRIEFTKARKLTHVPAIDSSDKKKQAVRAPVEN